MADEEVPLVLSLVCRRVEGQEPIPNAEIRECMVCGTEVQVSPEGLKGIKDHPTAKVVVLCNHCGIAFGKFIEAKNIPRIYEATKATEEYINSKQNLSPTEQWLKKQMQKN